MTGYALLKGNSLDENYDSIVRFRHEIVLVTSQVSYDGITMKQVKNFKQVSGLRWQQIAYLLLIAERRLRVIQDHQKLSFHVGDKFVGLVNLYSTIYYHLDDRERGNQWLTLPKCKLGYRVPLEYLRYQIGYDVVTKAFFEHSYMMHYRIVV